jgi:hypothetical protein
MATEIQSKYIADLAVVKTKEFKEAKELLLANDIVGPDAEIVKNARDMAEITNALTDMQASKFIDVLIKTKTPVRQRNYAPRRVERTIELLDDIKATINGWVF